MSTLADVNPKLKALTEAGVSIWLDQLGRSLVAGGELKRMVEQESLRGVTSNPSIFEKSILGTSDYDDAIAELARADKSAKQIYDTLTVADVQAACDVLASVHEDAGGRDGFVSLEVAPDLARDTAGTLESARSYWKAVDRANVMIKIPGTAEGVDAIEEAIYDGINVNVTLLFAVRGHTSSDRFRALHSSTAASRAPPRRGQVARSDVNWPLPRSSSRASTRSSTSSSTRSGAPTPRS